MRVGECGSAAERWVGLAFAERVAGVIPRNALSVENPLSGADRHGVKRTVRLGSVGRVATHAPATDDPVCGGRLPETPRLVYAPQSRSSSGVCRAHLAQAFD